MHMFVTSSDCSRMYVCLFLLDLNIYGRFQEADLFSGLVNPT